MKNVIHFLSIFLFIGLTTPLRAQSDKFTERVLATIPDTYKMVTFAYVAPDGVAFVYAGQKEDGTAVSFCGKEIVTGLENEIELSSKCNNNCILLFGSWDQEKYVLIFNNRVFKTQANKWGNHLSSEDVSPNGQHIAYLAEEKDKENLYVDGTLIAISAQYLGSSSYPNNALRINNDGLWVITARKHNKDYILTLDREFGPYDGVGEPVFSPDGKHLAFFAHNGNNNYLVIDGEKKYDVGGLPYCDYIAFSPNGSSICHFMNKNGNYYLAVDGENLYPFKGVEFGPQWVAGKWLYEIESNDNSKTIVYGDQITICENLSELSKPVVSKDGKVLAYSGNLSGHTFTSNGEEKQVFEGYIVLNCIKEKALSCVMSFVLSANGKVAAYVAEYRKVVKDDIVRRQVVVIKNLPGKVYSSIDHLTCSDNGNCIAYVAHDSSKTFFVMGTQESEPFDQVWQPTFSDDGKKVAYAARKGRQLLWKVIEIEKIGK